MFRLGMHATTTEKLYYFGRNKKFFDGEYTVG